MPWFAVAAVNGGEQNALIKRIIFEFNIRK